MLKRTPELFLVDILVSIDKIKRRTKSLPLDKFYSDEDVFEATIRDLEVIGEAAKNIKKVSTFIYGSNIEWQKIVDFRNVIAHEYFGIIPTLVMNVVKDELPTLEQDIFTLMEKQEDQTSLQQAIIDAKTELERMNRRESVAHLNSIEKTLK